MACLRYGRRILRRGSNQILTNPIFFAPQGVRYRNLEVILTNNVGKLGKAGDTVKVKPGFFRNQLMPKLLAVPNVDKFAYLMSKQQKIYQQPMEIVVPNNEEEEERIMKEYETAARRPENAKLVLRKLSTKGNKVREPVSKGEIVAEVARQLSVQNLHLPSLL